MSLEHILHIPKAISGKIRDQKNKLNIKTRQDGYYFKQPLTPYNSQWSSANLVEDIVNNKISAQEDPKWADSGACTKEEYEMYSWQICGMACFKMILEILLPKIDYPLVKLAKVAKRYGVYTDNNHSDRRKNLDGLYHKPLIEYAKKFHLDGFTSSYVGIHELAELINNNFFIIASVHHSIRERNQQKNNKKGHMVLVNGYRIANGSVTGFFIHNPSGFFLKSQANNFIETKKWNNSFSGRIIALKKI